MLEHRFYGESLPFGKDSMSISKLVFLNSEQALKDLAYFTQQMISQRSYGISNKNPWISISGSYPGALAAWFAGRS